MEIDRNGVYIPYKEFKFIRNTYNACCNTVLPLSLKMFSKYIGSEITFGLIKEYMNVKDSLNDCYEILKLMNEKEEIDINKKLEGS